MEPLELEGGIGFEYVRDLDSDLSSSINKQFFTSLLPTSRHSRGFPGFPWIPLNSLEFPGIPGIPEALFSKWEFQVTTYNTDVEQK